MEQTSAVVIGASQAGLSMSHELKRVGIDHVVLERKQIGNGWQQRWDSFCLVTPNWSVQLPGYHYDGDDPEGFMPRDEVVAYLQRYASSFNAPVYENVNVDHIKKDDKGFLIGSDSQQFRTKSLVLATGAFQKPHQPIDTEAIPNRIYQIDLNGYSNPNELPPGGVLIIGSGQSGCQLAEELHEAGRHVVLACGRAPWFLRQIGDRDLVWWAIESGFLDAKADELPKDARVFANILASGHDGGHDLHLRTLQSLGVTLVGKFIGVDTNAVYFVDDLANSVAWGDEKYGHFKDIILNLVKQRGLSQPDIPDPEPFTADSPQNVDLSAFGTILYTGGFRPDFKSWLPWQDAFDDQGFPHQQNGASTVVGDLHFVGLHFLRKRKSGLLYGVGEDAGIVADTIAA